MRDLIERLERATGADRELDADICRSLGYEVKRWFDDTVQSYCIAPNCWQYVPAYTASLDAALTLVPEGFSAHVYIDPGPKGRNCGAVVRQPCDSGSKKDRGEICETCHSKPSATLALCIAALKAREGAK